VTAIIDTNVFLDVFLERKPFLAASEKILAHVESGTLDGFCCSATITDIYYIVRRGAGEKVAMNSVRAVTKTFRYAPVDHTIIVDALDSDLPDFEDAIVASSGLRCGVSAIITRNLGDFAGAPTPSYTPEEFLKLLTTE